jgi:uncharacterized protein DUF4198
VNVRGCPFATRGRRAATTVLCLAATLLPHPAQAHEFWLSPSRYRADAGDTVEVSAYIGTGFRGELKPYTVPRVVRFTLRAAKEIDVSKLARNGDPVMARFVAPDAGGALLAYEGNFADIELPGPEFEAYLKLEGLDQPLAARRSAGATGPGRERYARCGKTWVAGGEARRVLAPVGLTFELTPLADPTRPGTVAVRAVYRGRPLAGSLVRAWHRPVGAGERPFDPAARDSVGPVTEGRTDRDGIARLALSGAGEWMLSTVHMIPSADKQEADWESYWASLTFARER